MIPGLEFSDLPNNLSLNEYGSQIGAFYTISLIFITAIIGVAYARYEGLNTLKSGFSQLIKNVDF